MYRFLNSSIVCYRDEDESINDQISLNIKTRETLSHPDFNPAKFDFNELNTVEAIKERIQNIIQVSNFQIFKNFSNKFYKWLIF